MNRTVAPTIASLPAADLEMLSRRGIPREFRARTLLVSEGERSDGLYIILQGRVRVFVSDAAGREAVLSILGPGECFGEIALDEGPRSASVMTLERCRMLAVPRAEVEQFLERNPAFALHVIRHLIARIRTLTESVRSLALMDAYGRVARLLLESCVTEDGVRFVPERLTQAQIAERVGCSREMVSRILKHLVREQCITLLPDRILVHRAPPDR